MSDVLPATYPTTDSRIYSPVSDNRLIFSCFVSINVLYGIVDETRVLLKGDPSVEGSDYINASFIDVSTATTLSK